ncbi:MAG: hypothetical protein EGQ02_07190 [Enterobacter cloacae]|nr:hypothetical protein [Enterobacter cloacae]
MQAIRTIKISQQCKLPCVYIKNNSYLFNYSTYLVSHRIQSNSKITTILYYFNQIDFMLSYYVLRYMLAIVGSLVGSNLTKTGARFPSR